MSEIPQPPPSGHQRSQAVNWRHALADLMAARATIARIEAGEALRSLQHKIIAAAVAGFLACFSWGLLLLGGIPLIAQALSRAGLQIGWPVVTLAVALLHLLIAALCIRKLRKPGQTAFSVTRAEFTKDREWFKNLTPPES